MKNKLDNIYDDSEVVSRQYFLQQALSLVLLNPFLMAYTNLIKMVLDLNVDILSVILTKCNNNLY